MTTQTPDDQWIVTVLQDFAHDLDRLDDPTCYYDELVKAEAQIKQHMARVEAEAERRGRHAEVVKALFLIESLGPAYDVSNWLQERLEAVKLTPQERKQAE